MGLCGVWVMVLGLWGRGDGVCMCGEGKEGEGMRLCCICEGKEGRWGVLGRGVGVRDEGRGEVRDVCVF